MQTKTYHELQGEEILSQVKFREDNDWIPFFLSVGCISALCVVAYLFIH